MSQPEAAPQPPSAASRAVAVAVLATLAFAAPAAAQDPTPSPSPEPTPTETPAPTPTPVPPPPNDARGNATTITLGAAVRGDTTGSTTEPAEPPPACGAGVGGSVWYALPKTAADRDLVIELDAGGDLDAVADVVRRERSQLTSGACAPTDRRGRVTLDFTQAAGDELYVRVSPLANSVPGTFTLRAVAPDAPEPPPGRALPERGATGALDRLANPDDAYAVSLHAGTSYRVRLVSGRGCVTAGLYRPKAPRFGPRFLAKALSCDEYALFTPAAGQGGRYAVQLLAPRTRRGALPYRLDVRPAGDDDTSPGLELANDASVRGALRGSGADVLDLYRFRIARRSTLDLGLTTAAASRFDLRVVGAAGKRIACACGGEGSRQLRTKLAPGRYFVAVRSREASDGTYALSRLTRTITRLRLEAPGRIDTTARLPLTARVTPGARGGIRYDLERFDPLAGWQFATRVRGRVTGGLGTARLEALEVGRYRVTATYLGNPAFAPAKPRTVAFAVTEPGQDA